MTRIVIEREGNRLNHSYIERGNNPMTRVDSNRGEKVGWYMINRSIP